MESPAASFVFLFPEKKTVRQNYILKFEGPFEKVR